MQPSHSAGSEAQTHTHAAPDRPLGEPTDHADGIDRRMLTIAKERFGIASFRPGQALAIRNVLAGTSTLAIMPTGAGKSLCYQLPAQELPGVTLVVSPLIALMKDQHDKLDRLGLHAIRLDSTLTPRDETAALTRLCNGEPCIAYVTPERLQDGGFRERLAQVDVALFVVDEAHCISQWGHDFRPAYLGLDEAVRTLGNPPVLALTATAPPRVKDDILAQLGLANDKTSIIDVGLQRPNLHYHVFHTPTERNKQSLLLRLLDTEHGCGIIYAATVKAVDALADFLHDAGIACGRYHGRMRTRERNDVQTAFMERSEPRLMIATNAFGLGIDKQDVRFVVHYNVPGSLESYYQEAGRAGRDGAPANCILLYQSEDKRIQSFFLGGRYPTPEQTLSVAEALISLYQASPDTHTLKSIAAQADAPTKKARVVLSFLKEVGFARELSGSRFRPLAERPPSMTELARAAKRYDQKRAQDRARLASMLRYSESHICRSRMLLSYFGYMEASQFACGHCDNCIRLQSKSQARADSAAAASLASARAAQRAVKRGDADPLDSRRALLRQAVARRRPRRGKGRARALTVERDQSATSSRLGFDEGDLVRHSKWGDGEVVKIEGDTVNTFFPGVGERLLKARFLEKVQP